MAREPRRWGARLTPRAVWVLVGLTALLTVVSAVLVARHLTADARHASSLYARVFSGLADELIQGQELRQRYLGV